MKKIILILFVISTSSCSYFNQLDSDKNLAFKIEKQFKIEQKAVDLTKLTDFDWDNYFVVGCYGNIEQIALKNNLDLSNISENNIESSDWFILLVFIKNRKSIKICEIKRNIKFAENKELRLK